jgi:hypothetical protein
MFHFYNAVFVLVVDFNVMTEVQPAALTVKAELNLRKEEAPHPYSKTPLPPLNSGFLRCSNDHYHHAQQNCMCVLERERERENEREREREGERERERERGRYQSRCIFFGRLVYSVRALENVATQSQQSLPRRSPNLDSQTCRLLQTMLTPSLHVPTS